MKKIYISGKVRGLEREEAEAAFTAVERRIEQNGYAAVNPLRLADNLPEEIRSHEGMLLHTLLGELLQCDAIWMLDNWRQDSHGAACEYHFAKSAGIPVINGDDNTLLDDVLGSLYRPSGGSDSMWLKTSAEIALEIEDTVDCRPMEVADWLKSHGFKTRVVDGTVAWVVYDKESI